MGLRRVLQRLNIRIAPGHYRFSPEWMVLGVNNACNLSCKMCDVGTGNHDTVFARNLLGSKPVNMPMTLVRRVVDQMVEHTPRTKLGFAFTEPLAYPHLGPALAYAAERGIYTSITTNGLLLPRHAQMLLDNGLDDIAVSIDGLQDSHNHIRGNERSFQRAVEGIERLLSDRTPPSISVYCVITSWNQHELAAFVDHFRQYPLARVGFMHANFTTAEMAERHNDRFAHLCRATPSNLDEMDPSDLDLDLLFDELTRIQANPAGVPVVVSPDIRTRAGLRAYYEQPEVRFGKRCDDIFRNLSVKSNGQVIPAHGRCYDIVLGDLHEQDLPEIMRSTALADLRRAVMANGGLLPACTRCCSAF